MTEKNDGDRDDGISLAIVANRGAIKATLAIFGCLMGFVGYSVNDFTKDQPDPYSQDADSERDIEILREGVEEVRRRQDLFENTYRADRAAMDLNEKAITIHIQESAERTKSIERRAQSNGAAIEDLREQIELLQE